MQILLFLHEFHQSKSPFSQACPINAWDSPLYKWLNLFFFSSWHVVVNLSLIPCPPPKKLSTHLDIFSWRVKKLHTKLVCFLLWSLCPLAGQPWSCCLGWGHFSASKAFCSYSTALTCVGFSKALSLLMHLSVFWCPPPEAEVQYPLDVVCMVRPGFLSFLAEAGKNLLSQACHYTGRCFSFPSFLCWLVWFYFCDLWY